MPSVRLADRFVYGIASLVALARDGGGLDSFLGALPNGQEHRQDRARTERPATVAACVIERQVAHRNPRRIAGANCCKSRAECDGSNPDKHRQVV